MAFAFAVAFEFEELVFSAGLGFPAAVDIDVVGVAADFIFEAAARDIIFRRETVFADDSPPLPYAEERRGFRKTGAAEALRHELPERPEVFRGHPPAVTQSGADRRARCGVDIPEVTAVESDHPFRNLALAAVRIGDQREPARF
ncbi:hypothetical protein SDC9_149690 [bioreactor metagenome]|uniref:Uncharacterized protein n=1 Tax=bioreactor metagenome TaxID=1076179 RepID=A0A645EPC5_9ZZZZ